MHTYQLTRVQWIPRKRAEVFDFFRTPENLVHITPPALGFRILTPPPLTMKEGTLIDYTVGWMGVRMHWRTLITKYSEPECFIDEQLRGPYLMWHHEHRFREIEGGTEMADVVHYVLPFGVIGRLAHWVLIRRQLRAIFDYREAAVADLFGNALYRGVR